jgi:hypothetical protein
VSIFITLGCFMGLFTGCINLRRFSILLLGFAIFLPPDRAGAVPPEEFKEPAGLVWFVGTVEQVVDDVPLIDLGEVHTLRDGFKVAAVRYRDNHFLPLGVLEVKHSHPTWCQMLPSTAFTSEVGDLVVFVEAPGDLGAGDAIRDSFIRHRIVANANRNRYSTTRDFIEANELQNVIEKQPAWTEGNRQVAGTIRSPTVTRDTLNHFRLFMTQILLFQDYEDQGVDVAQVTSESWSLILSALRRREESPEAVSTVFAEISSADAVDTEAETEPDRSMAVVREVNDLMFEQSQEERNLIAAICATLLQTKSSNERQWMIQQLAKSQFPFLARQEQVAIDMETIMRRVRKTE